MRMRPSRKPESWRASIRRPPPPPPSGLHFNLRSLWATITSSAFASAIIMRFFGARTLEEFAYGALLMLSVPLLAGLAMDSYGRFSDPAREHVTADPYAWQEKAAAIDDANWHVAGSVLDARCRRIDD